MNPSSQKKLPSKSSILLWLDKASLIELAQNKHLLETNYFKSTVEGLSFEILVVPNVIEIFSTLFPCYCRLEMPELQRCHDLFVRFFRYTFFSFPVHS